jgi:hypothetical protein
MATVAVYIALGGTSVASGQADRAITLIKGETVKNGSLGTRDIRDGGLRVEDFRPSDRAKLVDGDRWPGRA